jgi:FMN phosphatase YigB (HAD superfamily)
MLETWIDDVTKTIMVEDTIGKLRGAKTAGMQTMWVPRRDKTGQMILT